MKSHVSKEIAAVSLGVSLRTIENMIQRGELSVIRCLGSVRIPGSELERLGKSTVLALRREVPVEVMPQGALPEALFETLIERKLAQMATKAANSVLEPFFQSKAVSDEIRRGQTLAEQAKWKLCYAKWGCLICETRSVPHVACGMCRACYARTQSRIKQVVQQAEAAFRKRAPMLIHDLTEDAKAALHSPAEDTEYPEREP